MGLERTMESSSSFIIYDTPVASFRQYGFVVGRNLQSPDFPVVVLAAWIAEAISRIFSTATGACSTWGRPRKQPKFHPSPPQTDQIRPIWGQIRRASNQSLLPPPTKKCARPQHISDSYTHPLTKAPSPPPIYRALIITSIGSKVGHNRGTEANFFSCGIDSTLL